MPEEMPEGPDDRPLPLAGVRVIDFCWIVAGPQATRILADLGAEVIEVENESYLDSLRLSTVALPEEPSINRSGMFSNFNRNKKSIAVNLHHPRGRDVVERLIATADAVTENFSAGAFERMGFGIERLRELNPDIIYASISGYGHEGRDHGYITWGPTAQAFSGLTYLSGLPDQPPAGWGFSYLDHTAGYYGAIALLIALRQRAQGRRGQHVDISQVETGMTLSGVPMLDYQLNGRPSERIGNRSHHPTVAPHNTYRCAGEDRWIAIVAETDEHWQAICDALDAPALADDPRFATNLGRVRAQDELDASIEERTRRWDARELMYVLQAEAVPAGAVQHSEDKMEHDPQLAARGFYPWAPSPELGDHRFEGLPFAFSQQRWEVRRSAPLLGEHTDEVLRNVLGCTPEEIAELRSEAAVG